MCVKCPVGSQYCWRLQYQAYNYAKVHLFLFFKHSIYNIHISFIIVQMNYNHNDYHVTQYNH